MDNKRELILACQEDITKSINDISDNLKVPRLSQKEIDKVKDKITDLMESTLSDDEVQFMYNMYQDPIGSSYIQKNKVLVEDTVKVILEAVYKSDPKPVFTLPYSGGN